MLKDCDLDLRKPILRYISKKNPHNPRYGEMKLYLKAQVIFMLFNYFQFFPFSLFSIIYIYEQGDLKCFCFYGCVIVVN